mmetsp:Transcript_17608/g.28500  ORF Transcript_17608/g.28500 Transcript_17608/m.28500 type:complete len:521 (+) Transcript_17608:112-1674(+)
MGKGKNTGLSLSVKKEDDFAKWYTEVITKSDMIEYYNISGCYILRPHAYEIWEKITSFFDAEIKDLGVKPCYFPMFVSKGNLQKEADHIEDFAPEVAWVTRSGDADLDEPIAIRPTSETIMYPAFKKWIRSHRDLPLRLNQWTNVVRWEFKNPTPFIRSREFLWQEGHTAFQDQAEADKEVIDILDLYARNYEQILAVPVIKGRKSSKEKFPGGDYTTTVEAFIPGAGRAVQAATSHSLGQNFSKMFDISFVDEESGEKRYVWQNSWGFTTRSIGVAVMVHSDNQGLVLPPRVAPVQAVAIHIPTKDAEENKAMVDKITSIVSTLKELKVRGKVDERTDKSPGWKYNFWEQRGVPVRIEIGPKDMQNGQCVLSRRDNGAKETVPWDKVASRCAELMDIIHQSMLDKARKERDERLSIVWTWDEFTAALNKGNLVLAPWCLTTESEEWVKDETKKMGELQRKANESKPKEEEAVKGESKALTGAAKTLCIPFSQPPLPPGTKCFTGNGLEAKEWCLWGRSY